MNWISLGALFVGIVCLVEGVFLMVRRQWDPDGRAVRKRLDDLAAAAYEKSTIVITRKRRLLSQVPQLHTILAKAPLLNQFDKLLMQANATQPLGFFLLLTSLLFLTGFAFMIIFADGYILPFLVGTGLASGPFLYLLKKKRWRMRRFEQQLPDALDLMARSLKAGHAFSGGLQIVAEEFRPPIGPEFYRVMNEINYGAPVDQALKNLAERVEVADLKFFTISVIIQRETGGNLAEILESIAALMRERFKLQGKIKALSAEGKFSGGTLVALPFLVAFALFVLNPGYLKVLADDPMGRMLVTAALMMMGMGVLIIKKLIRIMI